MIVPVALVVEHPWTLPLPGWETAAAIAGMSLLSTALASILYFRLLASAGATNSILVTFLMPVTAILLGVTVLGERLDPRHFVGFALLVVGLAAVDGRVIPVRPRRSRLADDPARVAARERGLTPRRSAGRRSRMFRHWSTMHAGTNAHSGTSDTKQKEESRHDHCPAILSSSPYQTA